MSLNQPMNKEVNESRLGWQIYLFWFIALIAIALLILPVLPGLVSNFMYSFSGDAPKIYWYLSRASGIVSFTILWISMALGLGITNKMARLWPGAPSAFAIHQYTGLLGLAFAIYHGLVLMGDHFVDFSLPRLIVPFSIAYETIWVGLGQVCFYIWLLVVMSFYIRQRIGQKTWRMIHYANFIIYGMAFLHGVRSGTDSDVQWISWYFWLSGATLVVLLAYRIYELSLKNKFPAASLNSVFAQGMILEVKGITLEIKEIFLEWRDVAAEVLERESIVTRFKNLPILLERLQTGSFRRLPYRKLLRGSIQSQPNREPSVLMLNSGDPDDHTAEETNTPLAVSEIPASEIKKIVDGSVVTLEGTYQGRPIRVRIYGETPEETAPEIKESREGKISD
jgi:hypothetical protein